MEINIDQTMEPVGTIEGETPEEKPLQVFCFIKPTEKMNNAALVQVDMDGYITIQPLSPHAYATLSGHPHECFQGCEDTPNFIHAMENALNTLKQAGF